MIDIIGWTFVAIMYLAYFLDLSIASAARQELNGISQERETERVADECERLDLPLDVAERLMSVQMIQLNEAMRRLGYALAPHWLARMLVPMGNPARDHR